MQPFAVSFVVAMASLSLLWNTALAQSLRGVTEHEEIQQRQQKQEEEQQQQRLQQQGDRRDVLTPNVIRTFYLTITASQPANPSSISSNVTATLQTQTATWMRSSCANETVVSSTAPSAYNVGTAWPGSRHLGTCNYLCIINQIKSCRLCGHRRLTKAMNTNTNTNTTTTTSTLRQLGGTVVVKRLADLETTLKPILSQLFKNITKLNVTVTEQTL